MVDGVNDGVSFVDNTLTTLTASVRNRGVPHEKHATNEVLEFNASVSKKKHWGIVMLYPLLRQIYIHDSMQCRILKYLHQTSTTRWCFKILFIFVSVNIFTVICENLLCVHSNIVSLETIRSSRSVITRSKKDLDLQWKLLN